MDRRRRDLIATFLAALGPNGVNDFTLLMVRKAAELVTMAEGLRAGALGGGETDITGLIKIENEARRALRALGLRVEKPPAPRFSPMKVLREEAARKAQQGKEVQREAATEKALLNEHPATD
jgi:hypothetical protein